MLGIIFLLMFRYTVFLQYLNRLGKSWMTLGFLREVSIFFELHSVDDDDDDDDESQ